MTGGSSLDLDGVDRELLARWEADLETRAPGVTLELHAESLSDEALADYIVVRDRFPDVGESRDSVGEWRTLIDRLRGADGVHHTILAREPDGTVSAMTEMIWRPDRPEHVTQEFTGVVPEARGRGLGKALKAAMLRSITECHPEVTHLGTTNATTNTPMLSINERMGFVRTIEVVQYEIGRDDLAGWLAGADDRPR